MLKNKKLFLFDIDGTISVGDTLFDGSRQLLDYIEQTGGKSYFITNNSTKSQEDYVKKFKSAFSLTTQKNQFITSGYMTLRFLLKNYPGQKIFVMGTDSFVTELKNSGLQITETPESDIACVVASYDSELTYSKLTDICQVLSTVSVPFYATNPDLCCPVGFGFVPDCGSICRMIETSAKKSPVYLGKPNPDIVNLCIQSTGFSREETLVIGDRLYTDIACGINAGVDTCVVFTGEARKKDMQNTPYPASYEFDTIEDLYHALLKETGKN